MKLDAIDCANHAVLAQVKESADNKDEVMKVLGKSAATMRQQLGESRASIQKYDAAPEAVTTSSLEALHAYSMGVRTMYIHGKRSLPSLCSSVRSHLTRISPWLTCA